MKNIHNAQESVVQVSGWAVHHPGPQKPPFSKKKTSINYVYVHLSGGTVCQIVVT